MKQLVVFVCAVNFASCRLTHRAISHLRGAHLPGLGEIILVSSCILPSHGNTSRILFFEALPKVPKHLC